MKKLIVIAFIALSCKKESAAPVAPQKSCYTIEDKWIDYSNFYDYYFRLKGGGVKHVSHDEYAQYNTNDQVCFDAAGNITH